MQLGTPRVMVVRSVVLTAMLDWTKYTVVVLRLLPEHVTCLCVPGPLLQRFMRIARENRVKIEGSYASLIVSMGLLEGLGRQLDPSLSLIKESIPFLLRDPETRKILQELGIEKILRLRKDPA